jgi:hypothetical protein
MIRIKIDNRRLQSETNKLLKTLDDIPKKQNQANIARAAGSIVAKEFVKDLNRVARSSHKSFHHLYEWEAVGVDGQRLVKFKRRVAGNKAEIDFIFKKSKKKVPIHPKLAEPGKTGKRVTRRSIFKNKAEFMESGRAANYWTAKRNIVFMRGDKIIFKRTGTRIKIRNPGGAATSKALTNYAKEWQSSGKPRAAVEKSKLFFALEKEIARVMSGPSPTSTNVRAAIRDMCNFYDVKGEI